MARRKPWIPVLLLVALVLAFPAFVGAAWWRAHRRLQDMVRILPDPEQKVWLAEYRRPALFGDPIAGNALDHYGRAGQEIHSNPAVAEKLAAILNSAYPVRFPSPDELAVLVNDRRHLVDEIASGLRCESLRRFPEDPGPHYIPALQTFLLMSAEAERQGGRDAEALRRLSAVLALAGDYRRGAYPVIVVENFDAERFAAVLWRVILSSHALTPADLEAACRLLDRIEEVRPTLADAIRNHHEGRRAIMVESYPKTADLNDERPEWRHFWSWTFKMCELADDLDRDTRAILAVEARPPSERNEGLAAMEAEINKELKNPVRRRRPSDLFPIPTNGYLREAQGRSMRDLVRVATALAWYEVETGRLPERLADLVPRYLPRDPVCPTSGTPFPYANGVLTTPAQIQSGFSREAGGVDWPIKRR